MSVILMKDLLEAGVHFGHQAKRWDPRMAPFIYTERNGIHIIDLQQTVSRGEIAYNFLKDKIADGGKVLFVGTKRQAQEAVKTEATRCGHYYVTHRWLGGMLTNFLTVKKSIQRLKKLERMEVDGTFESMPKKEQVSLIKQKNKLERVLGGIKEMTSLPDILFIIDPNKEHIAVKEAHKMGIPIISVVDSNCNPYLIDYPIPGNDDAIRAINLFMRVLADAVIEGENVASKAMVESYEKEREEAETKDNIGETDEGGVKPVEVESPDVEGVDKVLEEVVDEKEEEKEEERQEKQKQEDVEKTQEETQSAKVATADDREEVSEQEKKN